MLCFPRPEIRFLLVLALLALAPSGRHSQAGPDARDSARDLLAEFVAIKSVDDGSGSSVTIAKAVERRLLDAGFAREDVLVTGPRPEVGVVIARYRGTDSSIPPFLVMAHMDVVDARPEDWSRDPFALTEDETYFYGRGVTDDKAGVVEIVANFARLKQEGYRPERDIIAILTGDEETNGDSINWLANERRDLIEGAFALNTDAGGGYIEGGRRAAFEVQASEKMYLSFHVTVRNPGGHSSLPRPDNAIYQLAGGLERLSAYTFPVTINEVTRSMFAGAAAALSGENAVNLKAVAEGTASAAQLAAVSRDPTFNALLRTTCIPTRLAAGHADNALPQTAEATVNCRIFPGLAADDVEARLREVMAIPAAEFTRVNVAKPSDPSPLTPEIMGPIAALVQKHFGDVPVIATMSTGATDGLYLRNVGIPVYALSAVFAVPEEANEHGRDEKIRKASFDDAVAYWYDLIKAFGGE